jgi:uroporphyrinogen decarboxylase
VGDDLERWCIQPTQEIVNQVKANEPDARIIGFPKGIGDRLEHYVTQTGVDGVSLDWTVPLDYAARLQGHAAVQGNLDPALLVTGGDVLDAAVDAILAALSGGRFIFNLGHGIRPETPVENVTRLIARVRQ